MREPRLGDALHGAEGLISRPCPKEHAGTVRAFEDGQIFDRQAPPAVARRKEVVLCGIQVTLACIPAMALCALFVPHRHGVVEHTRCVFDDVGVPERAALALAGSGRMWVALV